jgi:acyl-CoA thioester hydrolase
MLGLRMTDFKFANDVTVRFAETDAQGIAHHASYLVWFEATRIEYLRRFRGGYLGLREEGVDALTLEAHARYVSAARFDDRLTIRARCSDVRGARFRFDYAVERDGTPIADGWTTHACVSVGDHRPTRVPTWLADAIADAEAS